MPDMPDMPHDATTGTPNPLTAVWTGPYGGVPPFDAARVADLGPALEAGMADQIAAIDRIAADPTPPTFDNTILPLERSGRMLSRVEAIYGVYAGALSDDAVQEVERTMAPRLAACSDQITQNERLFARVAAVYEARKQAGLSPEQQRVVWLTYTHFVRHGARLAAAAKAELSSLNQQLATLATTFSQNLLRDENDGAVFLDDAADLAGLSDALREAAVEAAKASDGQSRISLATPAAARSHPGVAIGPGCAAMQEESSGALAQPMARRGDERLARDGGRSQAPSPDRRPGCAAHGAARGGSCVLCTPRSPGSRSGPSC